MKRLAGILPLLLLAGCFQDRKTDLAACRVDGLRLYKNADAENVAVSNYVAACMEAKGYDAIKVAKGDCVSYLLYSDQPTCFEPRGWLRRLTMR